jgi:hypothetical protein
LLGTRGRAGRERATRPFPGAAALGILARMARSRLFAITLVLVVACGGNEQDPGPTASTTSGGDVQLGPDGFDVTVELERETFSADDGSVPRMHVTLVMRDEADSLIHIPLGDFMACGEPSPAEGTVLTLRCAFAGAGDALHVVHEGDLLVVYREDLAEELAPAERVPLSRFQLTEGATVSPAR